MLKKAKTKEDNYVILSQEDMASREEKYSQRLADINISAAFINAALVDYSSLLESNLKEESWQNYLSCSDLPKPNRPRDIRLYLIKLKHFQDIDYDTTIDWTLVIDENSILKQDTTRVDLTRKNLKATVPNVGIRIDMAIDKCLQILHSIERFFMNDEEIIGIPLHNSADMILAQYEVEKEIENTIDRLTYRVLVSPESYMLTKDNLITEYSYLGNNFKLHIWGLCNVPVRFDQMEMPAMIANIKSLNVKVQIPLSVLDQNLTLRCVHCSFDHFSQNAKSFEQLVTFSTDHINAGIPDLEDCLVNEWVQQLKIQDDIRNSLLDKRAKYEEALQIYLEKEAKAAKEKKDDKQKQKTKVPKMPKEVPILPEGFYPDTYHLFLDHEETQNKEFLDAVYNPVNLNLTPDEINLKEYILCGGIYNMMFVRKPNQIELAKIHQTKHEKDRKLYIYKDIVAQLEKFKTSVSSQRLSTIRSRVDLSYSGERPSKIEIRSNESELPYFIVKFRLPPNLVLWSDPVVCQYEETFTEYEEKLEVKPEFLQKVKESRIQSRIQPSENAVQARLSSIKQRRSVRRDSESVEKKPISLNIYHSKLYSLLRYSTFPKAPATDVYITNFNLKKQLEKEDLRNLERYCIPLIISSMKFPEDLRDVDRRLEETDAAKFQAPKLFRNYADDVNTTIDEDDYDFDFSYQDAPERLFPIFQKAIYPRYDTSSQLGIICDENTFCGVMEKLDHIRTQYMQHYKKLITQSEFTVKPLKPKTRKGAHEAAGAASSEHRFSAGDQTIEAKEITLEFDTKKNVGSKLSRSRKTIGKQKMQSMINKSENAITIQNESNSKIKPKSNPKNEIKETVKKSLVEPSKVTSTSPKLEKSKKDLVICKRTGNAGLPSTRLLNTSLDSVSVTQGRSSGGDGNDKNKKEQTAVRTSVRTSLRTSARTSARTSVRKSDRKSESFTKLESEFAMTPDSLMSATFSVGNEKKENMYININHWTKKYIFQSTFNREESTITIKTDRLGIFGFAFKRYDHFPFTNWSLKSSEDNPYEIELIVDTQYVRVVFYISNQGFRGYVTDLVKEKGYVSNPVKYIEIIEPMTDWLELKRIFREKNLNIFAEVDAGFYVTKGYWSQKHLAAVNHTYGIMALHCKMLQFYHSSWNRLASRRNIILSLRNPKDHIESLVRIEPEVATFVEIEELCSDDVNIYNLRYTPTWRNISAFADLHQLINSMYVMATDERVKDPKIINYVRKILMELQLLSFS